MNIEIEIETVPCLSDNYAYIIHNQTENMTCAVDVPEAEPIINLLKKKRWTLNKIVLTHHHSDHVAGVEELLEHHPATVSGAAADFERLPTLDEKLTDKDLFNLGNLEFSIMEVYGHTIGHIALYSKEMSAVFSGDSLMTLGCGRLFEGTPKIMWETLQKFSQLPPYTKVYSGHEYGKKNASFAISIDPSNESLQKRVKMINMLRSKNIPTVPSTIGVELKTNPFLRAGEIEIKETLAMTQYEDHLVFAELRSRRDVF